MVVCPSPEHHSDKVYCYQGFRKSSGSLAILLALVRAILAEQLAAEPIGLSCPLLLLSPKEPGLSGRKAMEWLKQKTSIAGVQVSNWMIVLAAIIIVLLIFQNFH
jgi:hypothetical protein